MKNIAFFIIAFAVLPVAVSCKKEKTTALPSCVQTAADSSMAKPAGVLFVQVNAFKYQDKTVYLFMPGCCDRYSTVWDENCNYLFSPSGGITGSGDGTHPGFFTEAVFIKTVWKDPRL